MQPTVLIADSSLVIAREITRIATRAGCLVIGVCTDGVSALAEARQHRPSIVTTDLLLPRLSGVQVARELYKLEPRPFVIAVTAVATRSRVEEAKLAGIGYYVLKPLSAQNLHQVFARLAHAARASIRPVQVQFT